VRARSVFIIHAVALSGLLWATSGALLADSHTGELNLDMTSGQQTTTLKIKAWHKGDLDRFDLPLGGEMGKIVTIIDRKNGTLTTYNPTTKMGDRQKLGGPMGGATGRMTLDLNQAVKELKADGYKVTDPAVEGKEAVLGYPCTIKQIQAAKGSSKQTYSFWIPDDPQGLPDALKIKTMGGPMGTFVACYTSVSRGAQVADSVFTVPTDVKINDHSKTSGSGSKKGQ
jgi:hypothetical protein